MDSLLCTIAETAALLRVSVGTVRRSIRLGIIPVKRIRTNIRISRAWLDSYVAECAPVLLTRRQVAAKLGVSRHVVDSLRCRGLLPTVSIAGRKMIPVSAANEYVKRNTFAFLRPSGKDSFPHPASDTKFVSHPAPSTLGVARPASGTNFVPQRRTVFSSVRGV